MNKNSVIMGWDAPPIKEQRDLLSECHGAFEAWKYGADADQVIDLEGLAGVADE